MLPVIDPASPLLAVLLAAGVGLAFAILPIGLAEPAALAIGLVEPPALALAMLAAFTVAHVAAKVPWYWLGRAADRANHPRAVRFIAAARALVAQRAHYGAGLLAVSAVASVPPFHLAAIAAGLVRIPFARFAAICLAGRTVRFGLLAGIPALVRIGMG